MPEAGDRKTWWNERIEEGHKFVNSYKIKLDDFFMTVSSIFWKFITLSTNFKYL